MPAVSEKQRKAMFAAASGHSTLGIPKKVGEEFVAKDAKQGHAAGILFLAPDGDVLTLLRSHDETNYGGHWALPGGKGEDGESPLDTARRETEEEIGQTVAPKAAKLLDSVVTPRGMAYHTFAVPTDEKFSPTLNDEHAGFAWTPLNALPTPTHPAVTAMLKRRLGTGLASDMTDEEWNALRSNFSKWTREEQLEDEHAEDDEAGKLSKGERQEVGKNHAQREDMPAAAFLLPNARKYPVKTHEGGSWKYSRDLLLAAAREARMHGRDDLATRADDLRKRLFKDGVAEDESLCAMDTLAFDKDTVRSKDEFGRLNVERANISKANVCEYWGREIPKWRELGLDPDRKYRLLRDPEELRKAAPTFNGVPILNKHIAHSSRSPQKEDVIGTTGTDAGFQDPHLAVRLNLWDQDAINDIEAEIRRELSCSYAYDADMTPGDYKGEPYDGVMRNIRGNHVALVKDGRAGNDVLVADEALQEPPTAEQRFNFAALRGGFAQPKPLCFQFGGAPRYAFDSFSESDVERDDEGKFASTGGGGGAGKGGSAGLTSKPREQWPAHIKALKLPPAWTDVRYSEDPSAALQAVGKDAKGRAQYVYSDAHALQQAAVKFARIGELQQKFDKVYAQNEAHRKSSDPKVRAHGDAMALVMGMGVRPGSDEDTKAEKKAYGASTLEGRHVHVDGDKVSLKFTGKKGVDLDLPVTDKGLATMLKARKQEAGDNGRLFPGVSGGSLLEFSHGFDGGGFKTKDFRTLLGTRSAAEAVAAAPAPKTKKDYVKAVREVAKAVSARLGNTPTVALQSYIDPTTFAPWSAALEA